MYRVSGWCHAVGGIWLILVAALVPDARAADVLIEIGAPWRYHPGTTEPSVPPTEWRTLNFDDGEWAIGPTGIGYGDNDDATPLAGMQNSYVALFARKDFILADPKLLTSLVLQMDYDDGFAAYLNGTEVARRDMGNAGQEFALDQVATASHEAGVPIKIDLTAQLPLLLAGKNVLAVEVRNVALNSSDLSFIPRLTANDASVKCPTVLACAFMAGQVNLSWTNAGDYEKIDVLRNGVPLAGSPFAGTANAAVDPAPGAVDATYQVIAWQADGPCAPLTCLSTVQSRGLGTLQCVLSLVGGSTEARLTWTNIPDTVRAEVRREGTLMATLIMGEEEYLDPNVESQMPENDTNFEVKLFDGAGNTATMTCGADISLCPTITCGVVKLGGVDRARIQIGNLVKEWATFTVSRTINGQTVQLASGLPGTSTEYVDESVVPEAGVTYTYTLDPVAPPNEQAPCTPSCSFSPPAPEIADYDPPQGGWDYSLDFEGAGPLTLYNASTGQTGNLDGNWIRSVDHDFWDGSRPDEVGAPPDGPAPGGIEVVSLAGLGPCGKDIKALRILDPGNPAMPAGSSLAAVYPDPFTDPSNKAIFLGFEAGVSGRNLLRTGVTFAARWRIAPDPPAYMNAQPTGDGQPLLGGALGDIGFHFVNRGGALAGEGPTTSVSFAMNSGDVLLFSADNAVGGPFQLSLARITTFRSLWVTVEDPDGDGSYSVTIYTNGRTTPFAFATGDVRLESAPLDFGAASGNYLAIGLPDVGNDGLIEIDAIAYKVGVHPPTATPCSPVTNQKPHARIVVTPANQVRMAGGSAQVTLDGSTSDDGDGGAQGLAYAWTKVNGPAGDSIKTPAQRTTPVTFAAPGTYTYRLTVNDGQPALNLDATDTSITVLPESTGGKTFRRGDADANGTVDVTDAVKLLNFLFLGGTKPECLDAADADDSGTADISDAVSNLSYQFLGGVAPAPPGPAVCGPDVNLETPDLGCDVGC